MSHLMTDYDESDDIVDLLSSSLREQANATQTPPSENPEADETESSRRRRTRLDFSDELKPLTEEQQSDEQRAALLNAAIPEKARTSLQKKIGTRVDIDLWKDCDRGIAAQRRLTGTHVNWSSSQRVIFMIMQLIPITEFAPELYEWGPNKTKNAAMVKLADTYSYMRPAIIKNAHRCHHISRSRSASLD